MEGFAMHPQLPFVAPYHHPHHPLHQPPLPAHHLHHLHHLPQHHLINYPNAPLPPLPLPHHHHQQHLHHHHHHHLAQHAYLRPITPPPSPHDPTYAASSASPSTSLSSSTSTAATSSWDRQSVSSAATSTDDRARTPRPTDKSTAEVDGRAPSERFLLISTVPQDSTNESLRAAFRPFGDILGIYKLFLKDGIVILAFYDSRQCLEAHQYLNHHHLFPPAEDSPASPASSSQLLTAGQLASLIGDSDFIREAEGVLRIHAEAFVNGTLLHGLLEQYGELCSFESLDANGLLYKCEYYDARHAHSAMSELNSSTSYPLGVPLKISLDRSASSSTQNSSMPLPSPLINIAAHHLHRHPHSHSPSPAMDHAAYMFPPTPTTPHYPQLATSSIGGAVAGGTMDEDAEDEDEVESILLEKRRRRFGSATSFASASTASRRSLDPLRGRHDTIQFPAQLPANHSTALVHALASPAPSSAAPPAKPGATTVRSRRSSTGTSVVPGEDTPFALEKFRASLSGQAEKADEGDGSSGSSHQNASASGVTNRLDSFGLAAAPSASSGFSAEDASSVTDGLGLGLKVKETGAGLMLVDDLDGMLPPSTVDLSDAAYAGEGPMRRGRGNFRNRQFGSTATTAAAHRSTAAQPRRRPTKIALPPFMGPLPLPSPLPLPTFWSASSGLPNAEDGRAAAATGGRNDVAFPFAKGKGGRVEGQLIYNSEGVSTGASPTTPTKATASPLRSFNANIGPRLRTARLPSQHSSNSPTTPTTPSSETNNNGGIPPLYAAANRPLLPLSARTALSQTRDPPSPRNTVDLDKIANGMDTRTTIMIKNVPSRMTLSDMEAFINKVCEREYDFLYLRMDFVTGNNVGYAFVNFIDVSSLLKFLQAFLGKRWNLYSSDKVMYAAYATYQGKAALVTKFQNSSILDREEKVKPHIYYSSGDNRGLPEPFPPPNDSARKARSMAAASEHGLFSRMEYNRRQQLSQNHSSTSPTQQAGPKLFASSPLAARSMASPNKNYPLAPPQSADGPDYFHSHPTSRSSSSSYASPQGLASPHHQSPPATGNKANAPFGAGRSSARRSNDGPQTAVYGRRASATTVVLSP